MLALLDAGEAENAGLGCHGGRRMDTHGTVLVFYAIMGLTLTRTDIAVAAQLYPGQIGKMTDHFSERADMLAPGALAVEGVGNKSK